jgi:hypothetical protein
MASTIARAFVERLDGRLDADGTKLLLTMLTWFDRSSLWPVSWAEEGDERELVIYLANEAERFRLPWSTLEQLFAGMRAGQSVDWDRLERVR